MSTGYLDRIYIPLMPVCSEMDNFGPPHKFPRPGPDSGGPLDRIPGGMRMPRAAGPLAVVTRWDTSTRALTTAMAGTTQSPQLHRIPCHANLPMF